MALIAAALPITAADAAQLRFAPASPWQVDQAPQLCRLSRDYAAGEERMTLRLEQFRPGSGVQAVVIGDRVMRTESLAGFKVRLGRTAPFRAATFPLILPDQRAAMLLNFQFVKPSKTSQQTWPDDASLTAIDEIEFSAPVMGTLVFPTRTLVSAMAEMRKCAEDMVRDWGFDPAEQAALSRQPEPASPPRDWLTFGDLGRRKPFAGQLDSVLFRIDVGKDGAPFGCHVARSYGNPALAERSCALLLQRARFNPALDASGKPVASFWLSRVTQL